MADDSRISPLHQRWRWLVWSAQGPHGAAKRAVLQVLFDFLVSSPEGRIYPSVETIAVKAGVTDRHVRRHLIELEAAGWVQRKSRGAGGQGWRRTEYVLAWPVGFDPKTDPWLSEVERKRLDARDAHRMAAGWQPETDEEAARWEARAPGESAAAHERLAMSQPDPRGVPAGVDPVAWREYVDYRDQVHPMSADAAKQAAGRLWKLDPEEQRRRVRRTIETRRLGLPARGDECW